MGDSLKTIGTLIILLSLTLFTFCKRTPQVQPKLEIWEDVQKAVFARDIDYLLSISSDTLDCLECNMGESKVSKEDFFNNYLEEIDLLKNEDYSYFVEKINSGDGFEKRYRVNYRYKNGNTICTVLEGNGKIKFKGCLAIP